MKQRGGARDIGTGVIGYGGAFSMGKWHLESMKAAGMTPVAVADVEPARRAEAERHFPGIRTYESAAAMLGDADVKLVAVVTPHNTHARLGVQCLRAGRHVVCEKPFAITTAECDLMIREARRRGLVLSVCHNRHWDGCIMEAGHWIRGRRAIGDVFRIEARMGGYGCPGNWWRSSKSISGGILYDWGAHLLEYAFQLVDAEMLEVAGYAKTGFWAPRTDWKADTNEDEAVATVRFDNGVWLSLSVSSIDHNRKPGILEIAGTRGTYVMDHRTYRIVRREGDRIHTTEGNNRAGRSEAFYRNVADHLVKGTGLAITPEWSRRTIHVLDLASRSARLGRALRVKYG